MEVGTTGLVFDVPMVKHGIELQGELMVGAVDEAKVGGPECEELLVDKSQAWTLMQYA